MTQPQLVIFQVASVLTAFLIWQGMFMNGSMTGMMMRIISIPQGTILPDRNQGI